MNGKQFLLSVLLIVSLAVSSKSQTVDIKQISGTGIETAAGMITDHAGSVIAWGTFTEIVDFDPGPGVFNLIAASNINDGYVAKYNSLGVLQWAKRYGGVNSFTAITGVDVDQNNNVYISGAFTGTIDVNPSAVIVNIISSGDVDLFFTRLDASGNYIWSKHIGGPGTDQADGIETNDLNHFYLGGVFSNTVDFDPNIGVKNLTTTNPGTPGEENRAFIAKYDLNGNLIWAENVGGRGGKILVNKNSVNNDYILFYGGGSAYNNTPADFDPSSNIVSPVPPPLPGANYAVLAKYDADGKYVWSVFFRTYTGMNASAGPGIAKVLQDSEKNIYVGGSYVQSLADYPANIISLTPIGQVYPDAMLIKLDAAGGLIWQKKIGAANAFDYISDMVLDEAENVQIAGSFGGFAANAVADFNIPGTPQTLTSNGNYDGYTASYNPDGNLIYTGSTGGAGSDYMAAIASFNNKTWLFGGFESQADCDPFAGVTTLTANGVTDLFLDSYLIAKFSCDVPQQEFTSAITSSSAKLNWSAESVANKYKVRYRQSINSSWASISSTTPYKKLQNLAPSTQYDWEVKSVCSTAGLGTSGWSAMQQFTTKPLRLSTDDLWPLDFKISPNPLTSSATMSFNLADPSLVSIELFSLEGKKIKTIISENFEAGDHELTFNRESLSSGIYLLKLRRDIAVITKKIVIE